VWVKYRVNLVVVTNEETGGLQGSTELSFVTHMEHGNLFWYKKAVMPKKKVIARQ
jgi:hypothetical protein